MVVIGSILTSDLSKQYYNEPWKLGQKNVKIRW
jgi:hypothetical protein